MAMTQVELETRATSRAADEGLHTFRLAGQDAYLVKSRKSDPGGMHVVRVDSAGHVLDCSDCKGWEYRRSCTHAAAVSRRLEREARKTVTFVTVEPTPIITSACRGRSQLYREA
jgi:hypothetical protein